MAGSFAAYTTGPSRAGLLTLSGATSQAGLALGDGDADFTFGDFNGSGPILVVDMPFQLGQSFGIGFNTASHSTWSSALGSDTAIGWVSMTWSLTELDGTPVALSFGTPSDVPEVPEPSSLLLAVCGLAVVAGRRAFLGR